MTISNVGVTGVFKLAGKSYMVVARTDGALHSVRTRVIDVNGITTEYIQNQNDPVISYLGRGSYKTFLVLNNTTTVITT